MLLLGCPKPQFRYVHAHFKLFTFNPFRGTAIFSALLQAAIGSTALDMARNKKEASLQSYGMDVLTVAVLAILLTAPVGALVIGLVGPRLLRKPKSFAGGERVKPTISAFFLGR